MTKKKPCIPNRSREVSVDVCAKDSNKPFTTLDDLVEQYKKDNMQGYHRWLGKFHDIIDCICGEVGNSVPPINRKYKKNSHQYRLSNTTIEKAFDILKSIRKDDFNSFESLYDFVRNINVNGFGILASYDFALRYGYSRGIKPQNYVYIHQGTKKGAQNLKKINLLISPRLHALSRPIPRLKN